jgi:hypothetical protein
MYNPPPRINLPQSVHVTNRLSGEDLYRMIKVRESAILDDLDDNEELIAEYLTPTGRIIRIRDVGYYRNIPDLLFLVGNDVSGDECQVIAPVQSVQMVFSIITVKDRPPERRPIGFRVEDDTQQPES